MSFMQGNVIAESVLASAVGDADIVLEAVVEDVQIKKKIFQGMRPLPMVRILSMISYKISIYRHSFIVL